MKFPVIISYFQAIDISEFCVRARPNECLHATRTTWERWPIRMLDLHTPLTHLQKIFCFYCHKYFRKYDENITVTKIEREEQHSAHSDLTLIVKREGLIQCCESIQVNIC